jgi:hypothetical protein
MTPEKLTAVSAFLTFLVIAVSAVAALVQLRHIRSSNQLTALIRYTEWFDSLQMQTAIKYVWDDLPKRLHDAEYRGELLRGVASRAGHPELLVCDWVEQAGSYIKYGLLAEDQFLDLAGAVISSLWDCLEPVVALRRINGGAAIFENFEYLALRSKAWLSKHPSGNYPPSCARMMTQERAKALVDELSAS